MSASLSLYAKALRLMNLRAGDGLAIGEVCRVLGVSRRALRRHFLENSGRTPSEELVRIRMVYATHLLTHTDFPIKTVAVLSGYRRVSNFSDFIRRQTGLPPRELRLRKQQSLPARPLNPVIPIQSFV
jgi:transcriptional regulator GlxA family with amidase domain